jgi:hypothetical protein
VQYKRRVKHHPNLSPEKSKPDAGGLTGGCIAKVSFYRRCYPKYNPSTNAKWLWSETYFHPGNW